MSDMTYSGFVAIVGRPNVGKSTLLNRILGQKVSITSRKPQTTRHRILGIDTEENRQTVYVDTPGLHIDEKRAINRLMNRAEISPISATKGTNVEMLRGLCSKQLQEGDFYFPEDYVTDRSSRFMASEIIREKLMRFTGQELPYSTTVEIEQFKVSENGTFHINALILVERDTQKRMVIGNKGAKLKTIGTEARRDMETLFDNKVFLECWVKVKSGWADDDRALRSLGYGDEV